MPNSPITAEKTLKRLILAPLAGDRRRGMLIAGGLHLPCALGRTGIRAGKREGDGATPAGRLRLVALLYRADRIRRPSTRLPAAAIRLEAGWCDDPADRRYNRPVRLPYPGRHERLWRSDRLYDLLVVLDFNLARPRRGGGSAIFLHLAHADFGPTEGCIAVRPAAMRHILARVGPSTVIDIR